MAGVELLATVVENYDLFGAMHWIGASDKCLEDLKSLQNALLRKDITSLKFIDSSSKIGTGLLHGNIADFGEYDECLSIPNGKHCLAEMRFPEPENNVNHNLVFGSYCIPYSCSAQSMQNAFASILGSANATVSVDESYCSSSVSEKLSVLEILSICVHGLMLVLCLLSTFYDIFRTSFKKEMNGNLLTTFSFLQNGRQLLSVKEKKKLMPFLHGMKFISITWIIITHRFLWTMSFIGSNKVNNVNHMHSLDHQLANSGHMAVDTFFLISAFLNTYGLMRLLDKTHRFPIFKYYFHRYIRTTPVLAAMVLVDMGWFTRIGDGPFWKISTAESKDSCTENGGWWSALLYVNNYVQSDNKLCIGQSWYLSTDMQLYCLAPFVILPCRKWPKIKKFFLGFLLFLSTAVAIIHAYVYKQKSLFLVTDDTEATTDFFGKHYYSTHIRASPYILGIILGFYNDNWQKSGKKISLKPIFIWFGWLATAGVCLFVSLYNHFLNLSEEQHPYNPWESTICVGLFRLAWACCMSWIILACLNGYGGIVNRFLSQDIFLILGRLTYSIYLVHNDVIFYQLGSSRSLNYGRDFEFIYLIFGDLSVSILIATALSLIFEMPIMAVEKSLTARSPDTFISTCGKSEDLSMHNASDSKMRGEPGNYETINKGE